MLEDKRIVIGRWEWLVLLNIVEISKMRIESLNIGFGLMKVVDDFDESSFNGVIGEKVWLGYINRRMGGKEEKCL